MTAVFVHGVPETHQVWNRLRRALRGESLALRLPGFGTPRPPGFGATKDDYVEWLESELWGVDGPIDLVGHDWGAALVLRVATASDVPLRSWAADAVSGFHPDYAFHDLARVWQTPGAGEEWMAATLRAEAGAPESLPAILTALGVPDAEARAIEAGFDDVMAQAILDLYRSAVPNQRADWKVAGPTAAPGLAIIATADPFTDEHASREVADELGARPQEFEGVGHWWMLQAPDRAAAMLQEFWGSLR